MGCATDIDDQESAFTAALRRAIKYERFHSNEMGGAEILQLLDVEGEVILKFVREGSLRTSPASKSGSAFETFASKMCVLLLFLFYIQT